MKTLNWHLYIYTCKIVQWYSHTCIFSLTGDISMLSIFIVPSASYTCIYFAENVERTARGLQKTSGTLCQKKSR